MHGERQNFDFGPIWPLVVAAGLFAAGTVFGGGLALWWAG